jgi:hypothetical protein
LRTTLTATHLKDLVKQFIHERDRVVDVEIGAERASRRALTNLEEL